MTADEQATKAIRTSDSTGLFSTGVVILLMIAIISSAAVLATPSRSTGGMVFWTFANRHADMYQPIIARWNSAAAAAGTSTVDMRLLSLPALKRRMLGSFLANTESADLMEVERQVAGLTFLGPLDSVGFYDLTDRLRADGLLDKINTPSFSPWTTRGHIYGLPHDFHAVMLGYRADIVEEAGIDVSKIETWDDFERIMAPLVDRGTSGSPPHYLLNLADNNGDHLEMLLLQAGGGFFDDTGNVVINSKANARVLASIARWCCGPNKIAADAPNFSASGNKLKADGYVLTSFFPDWMGDIWAHEIPQLKGKMKLMPLPAWDRGERRTSVWGGTMLGIPRTAVKSPEDFDRLWTFAKHLYLSQDLARELWKSGGIVSPVKANWADKIYDEPNAYFSDQPVGRMYIDLAPQVPMRSSSPYGPEALARVLRALKTLCQEAEATKTFDQAGLEKLAAGLLESAHAQISTLVDKNAFLRPGATP